MKSRIPNLPPELLLALCTLFWAGNWLTGRAVRAEVPPLALSFWRWALATALLLPLAWPHLRPALPLLRRHWPVLLLLGVLGTGFYNALAYIGLTMTTVTNGVLLNAFCPLLIAVLGRIFFGIHMRPGEWAGAALSLAGIAVLVTQGQPQHLAALRFNTGDLWVLGSVLAWALYTLCLRWRPAALHPYAFLVVIAAVGLVAMAPAYAWELARGQRIVPGATAAAAIAYTAIFASFLGFLFWNRGVAAVGAERAGLFLHLMPVFGILLSAVLLGEVPQDWQYLGMACVFGGVLLAGWARAHGSAREH